MILINVILENTCGGFNPMDWIIEMVLHHAHLLKDEPKTSVQQDLQSSFLISMKNVRRQHGLKSNISAVDLNHLPFNKRV